LIFFEFVPPFPKVRVPVELDCDGRQYEKYFPYLEAVWKTTEKGSRSRPSSPAAPRKRPWLFIPQPKMKFGKMSLGVKVSFSEPRNPTEKDESPY